MAGKNHQIHLVLDKKTKTNIREESEKQEITMAEYCRRKIVGDSQLDRIEKMVEKLFLITKNNFL